MLYSREWNLSHSYSLNPVRCLHYFSNHSFSSHVKVINFSHLYWFPIDILHASIEALENLEELNIIDTDLTLSKVPTIFLKCTSITKLSVSIEERNLQDFLEGMGDTDTYPYIWKCLEEGLQKLTSIRLQWSVDEFSSSDMWFLIFTILR